MINIVDIYDKHYQAEQTKIKQHGEDIISLNKSVTADYYALAQKEPLFFWFGAATLGSNQIGRNLNIALSAPLHSCEKTKLLANAFSYGNQKIHNNIVAVYNVYKKYGISGLEELNSVRKDILSDDGLEGFKLTHELKAIAREKAIELAKQTGDFSYSGEDPRTIHALLINTEYLNKAKQAAISLVRHEQEIVQPMYQIVFEDSVLTLETLLNSEGIVNDIGNLVWDGFKLSGAIILDGYISTEGLNFADYQNRIDYFSQVFDSYFIILQSKGGIDALSAKRNEIFDGLGLESSYARDEEPHISKDFALTWDKSLGKWRAATPHDAPKPSNGIWVPHKTEPDINSLTEKGILIDNTFYYDHTSNRIFLHCSADFLPNLPPSLMWISVATYLKPTTTGYENSSSIYMPWKITTANDVPGSGGSYWTVGDNPTIASFVKFFMISILIRRSLYHYLFSKI